MCCNFLKFLPEATEALENPDGGRAHDHCPLSVHSMFLQPHVRGIVKREAEVI